MRRTIAIALLGVACRPTATTNDPTPVTPSPGALVDAADAPVPEDPAAEPTPELEPTDPGGEQELSPLPTTNAAEVGSVAIPMAEFRAIYDLKVGKYAKFGRAVPVTADARYRKFIVARLVYHEVLRQEAAALGVVHDATRLAEREAQQRHGIKDWATHLERRGETDESLRAMYIAELREEAILTKLGKLEVTRADVEAEYANVKDQWRSDSPRVRASHILFPIGGSTAFVMPGDPPQPPRTGDTEAEAKAKAFEVYALAKKKGADFAALAREHSTGPSALGGGDIGIFTRDRMAEEFSDAAFALKVGQVSKPVKTKFGWHIIKVTGRWPAGVLPMAALEDQIIARLRQRKLYAGRRELKDALLAKYTIVDHVAATL